MTARHIFVHVLILSNSVLFTELSYTVRCYVSIKGGSVLRELAVVFTVKQNVILFSNYNNNNKLSLYTYLQSVTLCIDN